MNRKLLSLIIAGCVIALVTTLPIPSTSALEMEYFPLAPGAALFYNSTNDDGDWLTKRYVDEEWEFNDEIENALKENFPFRPVSSKIEYRYKFKE